MNCALSDRTLLTNGMVDELTAIHQNPNNQMLQIDVYLAIHLVSVIPCLKMI